MSDPYKFKPFVPAGAGDSRSPCPALNALANHGYLPHSGTSISLLQLIRATREIYALTLPLALILSLGGILLCSARPWRLTLDLHDLARHGRIEHDGSLAHADTPPGHVWAPSVPDPGLLARALNGGDGVDPESRDKTKEEQSEKSPTPSYTPEEYKAAIIARPDLTIPDLARARARRDAALPAPLDRLHTEITRGEIALLAQALGEASGFVPRSYVWAWMVEERLPEAEGWKGPRAAIGLAGTARLGKRIGAEADKVRRG